MGGKILKRFEEGFSPKSSSSDTYAMVRIRRSTRRKLRILQDRLDLRFIDLIDLLADHHLTHDPPEQKNLNNR